MALERRALVLGGGGVTGIAWEIGLLHGLNLAGIDVTGTDVVIGTSAGSVVGAQITSGVSLSELYERQITGYGQEIASSLGARTMLSFAMNALRGGSPESYRQRIGRMALATKTVPESDRLAVMRSRLAEEPAWPSVALKITAVDTATGVRRVFDGGDETPLIEAVAASCAVPGVWPPVTIGATRYMDGGIASPANVDLAAGYDRVLVIAPITRGFGPAASALDQIADLRAAGAKVALVEPDAAATKAFGHNVLDPSRRAPSAQAGLAQAPSAAGIVRAVWQ